MNKRVMLFTFIISFIFVLLSPLFVSIKVHNFSQLKALRFGFPLPFIQQTGSLTPDKGDFPLSLTILNPMENVTQILIGNFTLSVLYVMFFYLTCWFLIKMVLLKRRKIVRSKMSE
jgi:hypothetical protein